MNADRDPRHARRLYLAAVAAAAGLLAGCAASNPDAPGVTPPSPSAAASTSTRTEASTSTTAAPTRAAQPALTAHEINRQDHPSQQLERRQRAAARARPMLPALPLRSDGVTIEIAGLAADRRTTLLRVSARLGGHAHALAVYRRELDRYGDSGHRYRPQVRP